MPTTFLVVRHGETVENANGRWQGQLDGTLTARGIAQAEALGRRLATWPIDVVYASDLGRTRHTAELITAQTGHAVCFDARLRERHYGIFQSMSAEEIAAHYPEDWARHQSHDPDYVMPGGESLRQLHERAVAWFETMKTHHEGATVLVVTHGGVLASLLRHVLGLPLARSRRFTVRHAALNVFVHQADGWLLETWGDCSHLTEV
ncbi:MAG: histidine phosphatase family protein [Caldilineales bacterium]|nr:histidine phosphatase family protein [Caldilineales bacterium]